MGRRQYFPGLLLVGFILLILGVYQAAADTSPDESSGQSFARSSGLSTSIGLGRKPQLARAMTADWMPVAAADDPLIRIPGTQPDQGVQLDGTNQCYNCHGDYDPLAEPFNNWQGSMMAQAGRDFLYWATVAVAGQDAIWAVGNPNATDLCLRCHMPGGWLGGRSDPTNGSLMTGIDFDGVECNLCHYLYDPFFETTFNGSREGSDWSGYWDETNLSDTPSDAAALETYLKDQNLASGITMFNGQSFFSGNLPPITYTESAGGQMFVSTLNDDRRASFADANANHDMYYSRYHKSKHFCSTCHDISNPVLHNLGADTSQPLPSEIDPVFSYYHLERTTSEFMLSDYGVQGGSAGKGPFAPEAFDTSRPNDFIASCQDCHMADVSGKGCDKQQGTLRPNSVEHPKSGVPQHDLTGGNLWVSYVLASTVSTSPNYDATNDALLNQGADVLTLDLNQGDVFDADAILAGRDRVNQMLASAASIENVAYDEAGGDLTFRVQNQTGHKLISGYPEGRRMYLNIRFFDDAELIYEINPYDSEAGTLKGLSQYSYADPDNLLPSPASLGSNEEYLDELVYEMHSSSDLTGENESFHFVLGTSRYKDNRIPPKGFRIAEAAARLSDPVWHGVSDSNYFGAAEYSGGYDAVNLADFGVRVSGADRIEIDLLYQTTSREYVEFLRNEINGTGTLTLSGTGAGGDPPYLIQTDPFFSQLKAWGDTIWQLWRHNMNVPGAAPVLMTSTSLVVDGNNAPVAVSDFYTTTEDITIDEPAPGVLDNDTDEDGNDLTAIIDSEPASGALQFSADGSFIYTPTLNFNGWDSFSYHADDDLLPSNIVTVGLTILPINDPPLAASDSYTMTEDNMFGQPAPGVLGNDTDIENDDLTAVMDSEPLHGTLLLNLDGSFFYTPTLNFNGWDSFSYHADDGLLPSNVVTVALTILAGNDAPLAFSDHYTTTKNVTLDIYEPGVLENDQDVDDDPLTAVLVLEPLSGSLYLDPAGSFVYTPTVDYSGTDSFTYYASDGNANSSTVSVTLTVQDFNHPPVASSGTYTTSEDNILTINAPGVLAHVYDPDGNQLIALLDNGPAFGDLDLDQDGSFIYTPTLNFNGPDTFYFHASDGAADSNTAVITVTVRAINDPPLANGDAYSTTQNMPIDEPAPGVLGNDSDVDDDGLSAVLISGPAHGSLNLYLDGSFVYTPTAGFSGIDSFTYWANDGEANSSPTSVTLTVESEPPILLFLPLISKP